MKRSMIILSRDIDIKKFIEVEIVPLPTHWVKRNAGKGTPADHLPVKPIQNVDATCQKRQVVFWFLNAGGTSRCCMCNHPIPAGHRVLKER